MSTGSSRRRTMFIPRSEPSRQVCDEALVWQSSPQTLRARCRSTAFLLALPAERTRCSEETIQVSKSRLTIDLRHLLYTHPLPLSGVDSRGLSVAACYRGLPALAMRMKEDVYHDMNEYTWSQTRLWSSLLYTPKQNHGACSHRDRYLTSSSP